MCKAMNRSFANVLFGGFGSPNTDTAIAAVAGGEMSATTAEDAALRLAYAERVIMVPGYGWLCRRHSIRSASWGI